MATSKTISKVSWAKKRLLEGVRIKLIAKEVKMSPKFIFKVRCKMPEDKHWEHIPDLYPYQRRIRGDKQIRNYLTNAPCKLIYNKRLGLDTVCLYLRDEKKSKHFILDDLYADCAESDNIISEEYKQVLLKSGYTEEQISKKFIVSHLGGNHMIDWSTDEEEIDF